MYTKNKCNFTLLELPPIDTYQDTNLAHVIPAIHCDRTYVTPLYQPNVYILYTTLRKKHIFNHEYKQNLKKSAPSPKQHVVYTTNSMLCIAFTCTMVPYIAHIHIYWLITQVPKQSQKSNRASHQLKARPKKRANVNRFAV